MKEVYFCYNELMKVLITLLFFLAPLFALNIVLNSGKTNNIPYAILHISDTKPFVCEMIPDAFDKKRYLCKIEHPFDKPIEPKKMKFAELSFYEKEGIFYIAVEPKVGSELKPVEDTLYETVKILEKPLEKRYTHWIIVLQVAPLYPEKKVHEGLDFPIVFEKKLKPYIGALDLNGAPISYAQSKDIGLYLDIKRQYEKEAYESVITDAQKVLSNYPHSIFRSEIELYSIRAMDKLLMHNEESISNPAFDETAIIALAKKWTKEFASDENIPEVFMVMAKWYLKEGAKADANYFMDILVSEHTQSPFTKKAILIFADHLFAKKEKDKAMKLYLDVLYSVQDLDIASEAAIRLSDYEMDAGKIEEAKAYLLKVLNVNAAFLLKNKEESYALAKRLYNHKLYDIAAKISDLLLKNTPKSDEQRESLLKESGDWHAKAGNIEEAYARYQEYLAEYNNGGEFQEEVKERLDELFFKRTENNETLLAQYYDTLIEKYSNAIGEKALIEKAKLLLKQEKYEDLLALEEALLKVADTLDAKPESLIYEAAKALAIRALQNDECSKVITLIETYKVQIEEPQYEEKLFNCFMRLSRFERAQEISRGHFKDARLEDRFVWAQREVSVLFKMGKYDEAIGFKEDLLTLEKRLKTSMTFETFKDLFFAHARLKKRDEMHTLAELGHEKYPKEFSMIDVYNEIVKMASETKNDLTLVSYAQKIIGLQKQFKSTPLSPLIEFNYSEALKRLGKEREALDTILGMNTHVLTPSDSIRRLYIAGELSLKLKEETKAKEYFQQCVDINETSSWKTICEENLKLF